MRRLAAGILALTIPLTAGAEAGRAVTCVVPSPAYTSINTAIASPACTLIDLGTGIFQAKVIVPRTLTIVGDGTVQTILAGPVIVRGAGTVVHLAGLRIDGTQPSSSGCAGPSLRTEAGGRVIVNEETLVTDTATVPGTCGLFSDDFETGDTSAWSQTSP